jgi:hypothetical protein
VLSPVFDALTPPLSEIDSMRLSPFAVFVIPVLLADLTQAQTPSKSGRSERPLRILLATTSPPSAADAALTAIFSRMLRQSEPRLPFTSATVGSSDHDTECSELEEGVVATLQPLVYLRCRKEMGDTALVPLFLVRKNHESVAYYRASFVVSKHSRIASLRDTNIRTLYLNNLRSASGFVAPLHRLADLKVIRDPSLAAARAKFGNSGVVYLRRRWDVARKVAEDPYSVGAVAGFDSTRLRAIDLDYQTLPQDVLVVTGPIRNYATSVRQAIAALFLPGVGDSMAVATLGASSYNITGVVPYDIPYESMYRSLEAQVASLDHPTSVADRVYAWIAAVKSGAETFNGLLTSLIALGGTVGALYAAWKKLRKADDRVGDASAPDSPVT